MSLSRSETGISNCDVINGLRFLTPASMSASSHARLDAKTARARTAVYHEKQQHNSHITEHNCLSARRLEYSCVNRFYCFLPCLQPVFLHTSSIRSTKWERYSVRARCHTMEMECRFSVVALLVYCNYTNESHRIWQLTIAVKKPHMHWRSSSREEITAKVQFLLLLYIHCGSLLNEKITG